MQGIRWVRRLITMVPLLLVLLLALILFGAGFALKILWWVALIVLVAPGYARRNRGRPTGRGWDGHAGAG
ncbi:hydrophobic protein [Streptomyces sp. NRRL S-340]|uniref:hydrophobic protein n=1 Tax=Streptomyces sp. NRRL S-340 TaxID=1463901 RepID=UPI00099BC747